ncbi:uncharacterized protein LOC116308482 [Actinia tenebrosa]|uniref:Uncharacterized protein LOC116308482 n=1 Tax=Actinia tenebrosa TaxID=6105 RepID=A0A6P8J530_ACTTE|nr:uncharacterized protein LOC116308482 [Actinia tenebrosa]
MSPTGSPTQPSAGSTTIVGKTSRSPTLMEGSSRIPMSSSTGSPTKSSAGNNAGTNKTSSDFSPSKRMTTTQMNIKIKSLENLLYQGTPTKQIKQNDTNHPDYDCQVKFTKVGCFADKQSPPRPLKDLLFTEKDQSDLLNRKHDMKRKVCRCAEEAKRREFTVFGLQFYDECWSGKDAEKTYDVHKTSTNCFNSEFKPCQESDIECVGGPDANYVYRISNNNRVMDSVSLNKSTHNNYKLMDSLTTPSKKPKLHDSRLLNESSNKPFKDFKNLACKEFLIVLLLPTRWRDDLKNPNTLYYKKARENIEIQILNLYGEDEDFRGITFEKFGRTENRSISKMYAVLKFDNTDQYLTKLIDYFGARNVMAAGCYTPPRCPAFCSSKCFPSCQPSCCIATYQPQPSVDYTSNPTYQQAYQTQPIITYNTQPAVMGPLIYQTINPPLGNPEPQATPQNLITSLGPSCPDGCQFVCTTLCPQNCCKSVIQKSKKSHIKKAF